MKKLVKSLESVFKLILFITLTLCIFVFCFVIFVQIIRFLIPDINYAYNLFILLPILIFTILYFIPSKLKIKNILIISSVIIVINFIFGLIIIKIFNTPLLVEPSYVYDYAKQWMNGPTSTIHALVWTHWGYYGLLLSRIFKVFGSSIGIMKLVGLVSIVILNIFLLLLQKNQKSNYRPLFFAFVIMSCYPLVFLFLNFPTGDLIYVGLLTPLLYLFNMLLKDKLSIKKFIFILLVASAILSFQNLFKDTLIVVLPILTVVMGYFLLKTKNLGRLILIPTIIIITSIAVQFIAVNVLQMYAVGVANTSKIGYFLATGTNRRDVGLINGDYYYNKYWGPLVDDYTKGKLDKSSYAKVDKVMIKIAKVNIIDDFDQLPLLFAKKNYNIWASDSPILKQTSFDDPYFSGKKYTPMEPYREMFIKISDSFLIFITFFFIVNCYQLVKTKKYIFINIFSTMCVIGFFVAFTIIEGQPRYRIIFTPLLIISAGYGIDYLITWLKKRLKKSKRLSIKKSYLKIKEYIFDKIRSRSK